MRRRLFFLGVFFSLFFLSHSVWARSAFVVRVEDGSTIAVSDWPNSDRVDSIVRLYGIGAPAISQPFGKEARDYLLRLAPKGTRVNIDTVNTDESGAEVALLQIHGQSVNYMLISEGLAWVGRHTCKAPYCRRWYIEEHKAVEAKKGIWSLNISTEPWQWSR